jgi:capsular exopolysaccharide synthesis family protein
MASGPSQPPTTSSTMTSAERAEGRTSIAASLACAAVRQGKTVLLIDADLRRPQLHELFAHTGLTVAPGLVEMLVGNLASPSEAVHETSIPGLYVVPAGRMQVSDASALLESPTMQRMLKSHLPQLADIIIIDTPPVHAGEPGSKIIHQADGVIIALRVGHSQMPSCKNVLTTLQRSGARVIGGVLVPAGEPNTGPILAHVETPEIDPASLLAIPRMEAKADDNQPLEDEPIPVIHIVAGPPPAGPEPVLVDEVNAAADVLPDVEPEATTPTLEVVAENLTSVADTNLADETQAEIEPVIEDDIEDVVWVSTNDTPVEAAVVTFGDDVTHRETPTDVEEPGEPTVADEGESEDDTDGTDVTLDSGAARDETATMDDAADGTNAPADKLSELLATWRRGAYDVAFTQPVAPVVDEPDATPVMSDPVTPVITEPEPVVVEAGTEVMTDHVDVDTTAVDAVDVTNAASPLRGIEALEVTFSMVPTGASEMTLRAESTNHGELGCLPIFLEMAMLVSAMRGMQAETPGPDATDGLRALLETKSSNANDNTALRLRVGSMDAPRIDATLHADGICHVRAGETRGDTQISISAPDGGTSSIVATTSLAPMEGRAVITLEREVLRRPYGDVRFINRIRLQLMK